MAKTMKLACALLGACLLIQSINCNQRQRQQHQQQEEEIIVSNLQAVANQADPGHQEESYQRVYEAFTKLVQNVSNNSLGNARRLVSRLNQLVGATGSTPTSSSQVVAVVPTSQPAQIVQREQQQQDEKTEQILQRLDQVNKQTDQHTLRQLQEDVNRLVGTLGESYLRNIRRVIERVNRTIGTSGGQPLTPPAGALHQSTHENPNGGERDPGFPGWDELITAVDRMQKSLANFVRSSTKLITAGRRR